MFPLSLSQLPFFSRKFTFKWAPNWEKINDFLRYLRSLGKTIANVNKIMSLNNLIVDTGWQNKPLP